MCSLLNANHLTDVNNASVKLKLKYVIPFFNTKTWIGSRLVRNMEM